MGETQPRGAACGPLDEAWWERDRPEVPPPPDDPILAPCGTTRPGFELLAARGCPGAERLFEERKQICERLTAVYGAAIWPPSEETVGRVYRVLEEATPRKRWLVACLWKKLQQNRADHGRGALDREPERSAIPPDALRP